MVDVAVGVWAASPQRAAMAIDRLMSLRLVSGAAIARWVFGSEGVRSLDDEVAGGLAWDLLYAAVDKTLARTQVRANPECERCTDCFCQTLQWGLEK